jgi:hypothetical protein
MTTFNKVGLSDTGALDAFSRLRTSNPQLLFATQSQYNTAGLQMEIGATGTGVTPAHSASTRMVALSVTAGTGTSYTQSYQYSPYEPGRSQFIAMTSVIGAGVANTTVDIGYFDANNGVIFRQNGTTNLQFILRTSTSGSVSDANIVAQSSWNIDKLDGTGASGITLDITKSQILIIDLQFLSMGRVRVGFDINGIIYYAHEFLNANNLTVPYMQTASLPVQMLVTATSSGSTKTAYFKCAAVTSEGGSGVGDLGFHFATGEATVTAASGARTHLVSIRPKTTFNGLINRELFNFEELDMLVTGANHIYWEIVLGAAFSVNPTYTDVNTNNSAFEYGTGGTFSNLTNGIVIASGYLSSTASLKETIASKVAQRYPITLDRSGAVRAMGTLSVLVSGIGGNSAVRGSINFSEIR